jgi:hypothetical protein
MKPAMDNSEFRRPHRAVAFVLCCGLFLLYLSNLRTIPTGDSIPARFLPFSLLLHHNIYLDEWIQPYIDPPPPSGIYYVTHVRGHWISIYPILTPLIITPVYVAPAWWLSRQLTFPSSDSLRLIANGMEKISAALLAALSGGIFFLALRKILTVRESIILTLVYAAASSTWSISSQVLQTHAVSEVAFTLLLWALLDLPFGRYSAFWAGLALGLAVANKLPNSVVALPIAIYFVLHHRDKLVQFFVPPALIGAILFTYNVYYFGTVAGGYVQAFHAMGYTGVGDAFRGSVWAGAAGFLMSPSRSLFIYMPWTIFSLWGAVKLWRENTLDWGRYLIAGAAALFLVYCRVERWWGGWTFGPRYLTDLVPFLTFFLALVWRDAVSRVALRATLAVCIALAIFVQIIGVFYYPAGAWDSTPVTVDDQPSRVWDWRDPQLLRTWKAGPAKSNLVERWRQLWDERRRHSGKSVAKNRLPTLQSGENRQPLASLEREYARGQP